MLIEYGQWSYCVNVPHFVQSLANPVSRLRMNMRMMMMMGMIIVFYYPPFFVISSKSSEADEDEPDDEATWDWRSVVVPASTDKVCCKKLSRKITILIMIVNSIVFISILDTRYFLQPSTARPPLPTSSSITEFPSI